ncbi:hypothetical protein PVAP13_4NG173000 [Panicum virgatum]|uniref:Uncharacterized protein n=1 Tax=Panicum virgatum TaxID=38727 RepID=A0A8T0TD23_PANVG|nr:hypothetical protein PVAP13_4NG173000 [Panicum virgatum]
MDAAEGCDLFGWHSSHREEDGEEDGEEDTAGGSGCTGFDQRQGSQIRSHSTVYVGNQMSTLQYEAVPRERVSQAREQQAGMQTGLQDPSTAAAKSMSRIQSLLRRKSPGRN